jgi:hypothetical protein
MDHKTTSALQPLLLGSGLPIWELSHKRTEKVEGRPLLRKSGYLYLADLEWCYLEIA